MRTIMMGTALCLGMPISYYLLAETLENETELYGVQVCCGEDVETLRAVTTSWREMRELLERLIRGGVTPTTLRDVVEDWLLA